MFTDSFAPFAQAGILSLTATYRGDIPFLITTSDEDVQFGIIGRETAEAIFLYGAGRIETRIPRSGIKEIQQATVSIMPEGLDAQLTGPELGDLIKFLLSLK